jgi:hypothetical protein
MAGPVLEDERDVAGQPQAPLDVVAKPERDRLGEGYRLAGNVVLIHVRFRPDGSVWEIAECPEGLSPEGWFKRLCARVGDKFQARTGGRGMFRISLDQFEALKAVQPH